jgi:DNA-binding XRE family transcriptional regulator
MRRRAEMTQDGVAKRLDMPRWVLSNMENGFGLPKWSTAQALMRLYKASIGDLWPRIEDQDAISEKEVSGA